MSVNVARDSVASSGLSDRRQFLHVAALMLYGAGCTSKQGGDSAGPVFSRDVLREAEKLVGLEFTDAERDLMLEDLQELSRNYSKLREVELPNSVPPAFRFDPHPVGTLPPSESAPKGTSRHLSTAQEIDRPDDLEELAFLPLTELSSLVRRGAVRSVELTEMYLGRLRRLDPTLHCVITLTEELALDQAERADREIGAGHYRGLLHGIPWGAKDLLSAAGYPTTWGAMPHKDQVLTEDATVVQRLEEAGAVLVAKLSLGALAWGDVWFGGKTRNPWNTEQGSSGSSAGPAAATAAGLVGFSIGSETWGSIVSPATRCGVTGLRPTFGRVSRHGAMALSWTMDKLGPMCRTAEDCAHVLEAIAGADGKDATAVDRPFGWRSEIEPRELRLGFTKSLFEEPPEEEDQKEAWEHDQQTLETLRELGFELRPIELPDLPVDALSFILNAEAAAAFDELTRSGRDDLLVRQERRAWPNVFRQARLIPAVEYIQANRVRALLIEQMAEIFSRIDLYVAPSFGGDNLLLTNMTGHPALVMPNGFAQDGTPTSISFTGRLYGESELVAVGRAFQQATSFHLRHPPVA